MELQEGYYYQGLSSGKPGLPGSPQPTATSRRTALQPWWPQVQLLPLLPHGDVGIPHKLGVLCTKTATQGCLCGPAYGKGKMNGC